MNIQYASDLHLEFNVPPGIFYSVSGDILILAGDIIDGKLRGLDVLNLIASKFNHIIMVMGNHEFYKGKFTTAYDKLKTNLPDNVHLLQNEIIDIDGQRFLGATLWSRMDIFDQYLAKQRMNDYKCVRIGPADKPWLKKLDPSDTVADHEQTVLWLEKNVQKDDIIITHHAPSFVSCNPDYTGNTAYATDLSYIMLDNDPSYWIHGHLHDKVDYVIGNTKVKSNPMGYYGHDNISNFFFEGITI